MHAEAHIVYDRPYFSAMYDDWLKHRSVWRQYATPFSCAMIAAGIAMSLQFMQQWQVGLVIAGFGVYELVSSLTHRTRWVNESVSNVRDDKTVDLTFHDDSLTSNSSNGTATMRIGGFRGFAAGSRGFFLIPDTGISLYIPRAAISPVDVYEGLVAQLPELVDKQESQLETEIADG